MFFEERARQAAAKGDFSCQFWQEKLPWTSEELLEAKAHLESKGFTISYTNEITAQYSNTDWDADYLFKISWEKV